MTIGEVTIGQTFRMDYIGRAYGIVDGRRVDQGPCKYAGETYVMLANGRVRGSDGRVWTLGQTGMAIESVIVGPVWGAASVDWPSSKHDDPVDAIMAALDTVRGA